MRTFFVQPFFKPSFATSKKLPFLGAGFKHVLFSSLPGEVIQFDEHMFQLGFYGPSFGDGEMGLSCHHQEIY